MEVRQIDVAIRPLAKKNDPICKRHEILSRDTAILTSENVGYASNFFFFAGMRNVLDTSKVDALRSKIVKNRKKSPARLKSVGHFSPLSAPPPIYFRG